MQVMASVSIWLLTSVARHLSGASGTFERRVSVPPRAGRILRPLLFGLFLQAPFLSAQAETPAPWRFALMGDLPYSDFEREHLPEMLEQIAATGPAFVAHDGDIKSGSESCADALLSERLALFDAFLGAFVLTPGDNEWTDCHRMLAGSFDPAERLNWLRHHFFPRGRSLGRSPMPVESQADDPASPYRAFRENLLWVRPPLLFATLNLPGSHNGLPRFGAPLADYRLREAANFAWLKGAFARAAARPDIRGVVLIVQADPDFEAYAEGKRPRGYARFLDALLGATLAYSGQVVFVHGDSHVFRIDHPLLVPPGNQPIPRFTRVETPGSPFMAWVEGEVRPGEREWLRFVQYTFRPEQTEH